MAKLIFHGHACWEVQGEHRLLLPIGDNFTMGIDDAVKATEFIGARMHLPMHFGTFPQIDVDAQEFQRKAAAVGQAVTVLEPGGSYAIP
jgi:L-ascorbate metabolism protein UlaG (beta-lactamase superfamily)